MRAGREPVRVALPGRSPAPHDSDESLVARVLDGDRSAFALLYDRYFPCVFARAARSGGPRGEVEAVVEATFRAVVSSLDEFQCQAGRASFAAWVLGKATRSS